MNKPDGVTSIDLSELEGLRFPHIRTRAQLDQLEQQNIQEGLKWLARQRKHKDLLAMEFTRELHQRLFGLVWKWAGSFRMTEKNIGVDPVTIHVEYHKLLNDARHWLDHRVFTPFEFAARFHHRQVQIHLFPNGNGRHSRIMTDALMEKYLNKSAINWDGRTLSRNIEHRRNYINALRKADAGDYAGLIDFLSGGNTSNIQR